MAAISIFVDENETRKVVFSSFGEDAGVAAHVCTASNVADAARRRDPEGVVGAVADIGDLNIVVEGVFRASREALLIPVSVISENASGDQFVFAIDKDNQAQKVFIQTGYAENGMVEVVAGLEEGATIISEGARLVKENQPVQIIK